MSKTLLAAALFAFIGLGACKQEEVDPTIPANYQDRGAIKFQNNSGDIYNIYLDDAPYGSLYGNMSSTYKDIPVGIHRVKALQTSNITGTATLRQNQVWVQKDSTANFIFP